MDLWNDDEPISDRFDGIDVPAWIDDNISPYDIAAIVQGGCASGAYMPAVTYSDALKTMADYGDGIFDFIESRTGETMPPEAPQSWAGLAVWYVSFAVELWASETASILESADEPEEEEEASPELAKLLSW